jgi:hypothetical protein
MISVLHTWGRILTVAGGVLSVLLAVRLPVRRSLEKMPESRGVCSDPRTLNTAGGADPKLSRRLREWLVRQPSSVGASNERA